MLHLAVGTLSEQLMQSLLTQEQLSAERDEALKRAKESEDKNCTLEHQLAKIHQLHSKWNGVSFAAKVVT